MTRKALPSTTRDSPDFHYIPSWRDSLEAFRARQKARAAAANQSISSPRKP